MLLFKAKYSLIGQPSGRVGGSLEIPKFGSPKAAPSTPGWGEFFRERFSANFTYQMVTWFSHMTSNFAKLSRLSFLQVYKYEFMHAWSQQVLDSLTRVISEIQASI